MSINDTEKMVLAYLDRLKIAYEYVQHAPAMTMADLEEAGRLLGSDHPKNLFLANRQKTVFCL